MSDNYYGQRLKVSVKNGRLIISIGVNTLAHAVSYAGWACPFDEEKGDYIRTFAVADPEAFAKHVQMAMLEEREDGSSLLSDFLDKASEAAINDGAEGCEFDQQIKTGQFAECETWAAKPEARAMSEPRRDVQRVVMTTQEKIASAPRIEDGEWYEPSENPFIQGCCDCGLAHRIEYDIENGVLSLRFYRDHEATEELQQRLRTERVSARQIVADGLLELAGEMRLGHGITKDAAIRLLCEAADLLLSVVPDAQKAGE
jgi:hypothetical protein